ncbi:MBL fold metallo-hydrolase [Caenimonas koreensis]|uniref:MBL fold metallo-hydrolase n=1 Tax=Caenimonas koreensis DSM 17982 TaxID=1121255 RepID=A0A844B2H9_9BURK|nr:MBL fold metallo-hydrolase [Caenimonas koreensis]MRD45757.1 MBL fold metallo-hydrolase [Caenimonas koreensis DSM 17982]
MQRLLALASTHVGAFACALSLASPGAAFAADPLPPTPLRVTEGIWLIPGSFEGERQPDGNTIIFEGTSGLVVMDTGRHTWHRQAIVDFAQSNKRPIAALINSHWHLDHTSGNADIKRLYPNALLYTGTAVEKMIRDVWPQSLVRSQATLDAGNLSPVAAADVRGDIETRKNPQALRPDMPVIASGAYPIDGVIFDVRLAGNAATGGDVWVYEPRSRIAAVGDLVTLPVPFLDTACVKGWRTALDEITATPFTRVIPGHGGIMDRAQFLSWRAAFNAYTDCARSPADKSLCAANWLASTATLRAPEAADDANAREMAEEYVAFLRENGGDARLCTARSFP